MAEPPVAVGGPSWRAWLDSSGTRSFRFESASGTFTARRELRGGTAYWYAYRKSAQQVRKMYLGRSTDLTLERLDRIATQLAQPDSATKAIQTKDLEVTPSASTMWAAGSRLPTPSSTFIGREAELMEVRRTLRRARLLTLSGVAGVGKTRLALAAAVALAPAYRDGARLVELAPLADPDLVVQTVAGAIGVQEQPGRDRVAGLLDALRQHEVLLILDNCEHVLDGVAPVVSRISTACPDVRILATSRERLGCDGEIVWPVPPLNVNDTVTQGAPEPERPPDAVRLFVERAAAVQPGFSLTQGNAAQVAQICRQLDGLPLAIELAAARVPVLGIQGLEVRLHDRLGVLRSRSRTVVPRQQTLRGALDWSYELLRPAEQSAFDQLSVFAGGWTLEAAEAVCETEPEDASVLDLLEALRDKSLLVTVPQVDGLGVRYGMLESLRQYGREHLVASGEEASVQARHAAFITGMAVHLDGQLQSAEQRVCLEILEREHDNARAALAWTVAAEDAEKAMRLSSALTRFWLVRGHIAEGRDWLERALALQGFSRDRLRAGTLWAAASLSYPTGALKRAEELASESLALGREIGDVESQAQALHHFAWIRAGRDQDSAIGLAEEAMALARAYGDAWLLAVVANTLGAMLAASDPARAATLYSEGAQLADFVGDRLIESTLLRNLGELGLGSGDAAEAERLIRRSLEAACAAGSPRHVAPSLEYLARASLARGSATRAARLLGAAARLRARAGFVVNLLDAGTRADAIRDLQAQLGEDSFAEAWSDGQSWSLDEATSHALSDEGLSTPAAQLLTPREVEVAALVVSGLTNRQIAERLIISERTVERHLENAFGRLGYTSRAQLAVWVSQQSPRIVR